MQINGFASIVLICALLVHSACAQPPSPAAVDKQTDIILVDAKVPAISFIRIGMTATELKAFDAPMAWSTRNLEGDEYQTATVTLGPDQIVTGIFDLNQVLYRLEINAGKMTDTHGLGVGSVLAEVQAAYPDGRLIYGNEEGRYVSFLTGDRLIFRFDPHDLDEACFDFPQKCSPSPGLAVRSLNLHNFEG